LVTLAPDTPLTTAGAGSLPPYTNVQYWRFRYDQLGYVMVGAA
jgi:hypothetical protein